MTPQPSSGWSEEEVRRVKVNFTFENLEGQIRGVRVLMRSGRFAKAFPHMTRDGDLSHVVFQGVEPSPNR